MLWKQTVFGSDADSAKFLATRIHHNVWLDYKSQLTDGLRQQEKAEADNLTEFFKMVTEWKTNPPQKGTFERKVYDNCMAALKRTFGQGWKKGSLFNVFENNPDSPHYFEKEIQTIIKTFINTAARENIKNNDYSIKKINIKFDINTGLFTTNVTDQMKDFVELGLIQRISDESVRSWRTVAKKKTDEMVVSQLKQYKDGTSGSLFTISGKEIKTDIVSPLQTEGTFTIGFDATERTINALKALNYATFSLKNYKGIFKKNNLYNMVTTGNTNILAVLLTIIPTYFPGGANEDFYIFMKAILSRYFLDQGKPGSSYRDNDPNVAKVDPTTADIDTIGLHFFHLQTIYELTGRGQQTGTSEIGELNNLLYTGTKFLLVNDNASNDIKCYSTRDLLYDLLNKTFSQNWRVDYRRENPSKITRYVRLH